MNSDRMSAEPLAAALRALPDDVDMIENNPDEGMRYFCCGSEHIYSWPDRRESRHAPGCWYVNAKAALAEHEKEQGK